MNYPLAGIDWKRIFSAIPAAATANALAAALAPIAGSRPQVTNYGTYHTITFDDAQKERLTAWIIGQLDKEPGPVRVDLNQIALQVIARKYWVYLGGIFLLGAIGAYYLGKAK
jgi:hypothetical protein